jgi:hypothetical protein
VIKSGRDHLQITPVRLQADKEIRGAFRSWYVVVMLIILAGVIVLVPAVQAREPDWNYSSPDAAIGGIAVSSNGNLIAVGAEKVLFFTRGGSLLDTGA